MSAPFAARRRLRFAHCDPAGIAYYPRYLELCDGVIEDWTEAVIGVSRRSLHCERGLGVPTADLRADFAAPSRVGDWLDFGLRVEEVGRSSIGLAIEVLSGAERRFGVRYRQVLVELDTMRSTPWPAEWRSRIEATIG